MLILCFYYGITYEITHGITYDITHVTTKVLLLVIRMLLFY